jgi:hypothetical protein
MGRASMTAPQAGLEVARATSPSNAQPAESAQIEFTRQALEALFGILRIEEAARARELEREHAGRAAGAGAPAWRDLRWGVQLERAACLEEQGEE